ncbi:MAG TPA: hypothetical protein VLN48_10325 [Bryobacteraceae bacterium]|nr:hypothetical protein [Bryobacteraceae bacterium]
MDPSSVNVRATKARLVWIAILAIALLTTSLQAKLGLYHPEHSPEHLVSKAFKLSECRLERAVANPPIVAVSIVTSEAALDAPGPRPEFLESPLPLSQPLFLSRSHWFRPPPVRS